MQGSRSSRETEQGVEAWGKITAKPGGFPLRSVRSLSSQCQ